MIQKTMTIDRDNSCDNCQKESAQSYTYIDCAESSHLVILCDQCEDIVSACALMCESTLYPQRFSVKQL